MLSAMTYFVIITFIACFVGETHNCARASPVTELVDCPFDEDNNPSFIPDGTTETCKCIVTDDVHAGTATAQWLKSDRSIVVSGTGQAVLSLRYNSSNTDNTYYCRGTTQAETGPNVTYEARFAYGPNNIRLGVDVEIFDLCPYEESQMDVFCEVETNGVYPGVNVRLGGIPGSPVRSTDITRNSNVTIHHFRFRPTIKGNYSAYCTAENNETSALKVDAARTIEVYEPPPTPNLSVNVTGRAASEDFVQVVHIGDIVLVTCSIQRGYPEIYEVTLECVRRYENTTRGSESSLEMNVTKKFHRQQCHCSIDHDSDCCIPIKTFTFQVHFETKITNFTVNSRSEDKMYFHKGEQVTISCWVEGSPLPGLYLRRGQSGQSQLLTDGLVTTTGFFSKHLSVTQELNCGDSNYYSCHAGNDDDDDSSEKRVIIIHVRCNAEKMTNPKEELSILGPIIKKTIRICVFPDPADYKLYKSEDEGYHSDAVVKREAADSQLIKSSDYSVNFIRISPEYGVVEMHIMDLDLGDVGFYTLVVKNGLDDNGGEISFNVTKIAVLNSQTSEGLHPFGPDHKTALVATAIIFILALSFLTLYVLLMRRSIQKAVAAKEREIIQRRERRRQLREGTNPGPSRQRDQSSQRFQPRRHLPTVKWDNNFINSPARRAIWYTE